MTKRRTRLAQGFGVLAVLLAGAYWWLFCESHPAQGAWTIDLDEVRRLAGSMPGDKPHAVRVERVAGFRFPGIAIQAGDPWALSDMPVFSYQLVFADRTGIVDTAMDAKTSAQAHAVHFDPAAYARMSKALGTADFIVVTHEHMDHLGGLTVQPNLQDLLKHTRLTREQLSDPANLRPAEFPKGSLDGYAPLGYDRYAAVAPGVVLIKAPGHTPGSQIVYVQRSDGTEYLLLGDVAWHSGNVEAVRERARAFTLAMGENRDSVLLELAELHRLSQEQPALHQIPGHDGPRVAELVAAKLLEETFAP
jgi:glyoxylase-like metal-dependent hydrolase (beta-lactamase superfamily II)